MDHQNDLKLKKMNSKQLTVPVEVLEKLIQEFPAQILSLEWMLQILNDDERAMT